MAQSSSSSSCLVTTEQVVHANLQFPKQRVSKSRRKNLGSSFHPCASTSDVASLQRKEVSYAKYVASLEEAEVDVELVSPLSAGYGMSPKPKPGRIKANLSMSDLRTVAIEAKVTQKDVVYVFGDMLKQISLACSSSKAEKNVTIGVFQGNAIPKVGLEVYLWRVVYYLNKFPAVEATFFAESEEELAAEVKAFRASDEMSRGLRCLLLALSYIDRISQKHQEFHITSYTLHRIVLTAMLVAIKFTDDHPIGVDVFARLGGVQNKDMKKMELQFCSLIGFDFHISEAEFEANCMNQLRLAFDVACKRGGSFSRKKTNTKTKTARTSKT